MASLFRHLSGNNRSRLVQKFVEDDHIKVRTAHFWQEPQIFHMIIILNNKQQNCENESYKLSNKDALMSAFHYMKFIWKYNETKNYLKLYHEEVFYTRQKTLKSLQGKTKLIL